MHTNVCDIKIKFQNFESTASRSAKGNKKPNQNENNKPNKQTNK